MSEIDEVIKMLDNLTQDGVSRIKVETSGEVAEGERKKAYHHGRCAVDGNENMKPMKNRSPGRIDIAVSWIIAMATAMQRDGAAPTLADRIAAGVWSM